MFCSVFCSVVTIPLGTRKEGYAKCGYCETKENRLRDNELILKYFMVEQKLYHFAFTVSFP